MTSLTTTEIKILMFGLFFVAIIGVFVALYNSQPVVLNSYQGETTATNQTTASSSSWISGLFGVLPKPFDDPMTGLIGAIIIIPITIMTAYIGIRAIKDLISQWV